MIKLKEFYFIDTNHKNLLNGTAAIDLRLLSLNAPEINKHVTPKNTQKQINKIEKAPEQENKVPSLNQNSAEKINAPPLKAGFHTTAFCAQSNIGKFTDCQVKLHIDEKAPPVTQPERRIPNRQKVKQTVAKLESVGILEEVKGKPTPWLNPIVDIRAANKAITRLDTPHQLLTNRKENHAIQKVNFWGKQCAEELQHALQSILMDIEETANITDDILIYAKTTKDHDNILEKVFKRLAEEGLTLNLKICITIKISSSILVISSQLMASNRAKKNVSIKECKPCLTQKDAKYEWSPECETAFQTPKTLPSEDSCISYFDENKETLIYCDASPVGISAFLLQRTKGKADTKVVGYSSRSLNKTEMRYSQIERKH
ncbi:uncharacterized protein LOC130642365 [Hydractinia symbiolongicarpus]|uniref:uncharacterized protein LOC130642365 n=1 Tax=Hydractinia symbiolongicarpus TaxID=13093 RepID=UPI002549D6A6|nr:uncharacterized protein LOC130642365 [Hydractinia symbiolongicarpus]